MREKRGAETSCSFHLKIIRSYHWDVYTLFHFTSTKYSTHAHLLHWATHPERQRICALRCLSLTSGQVLYLHQLVFPAIMLSESYWYVINRTVGTNKLVSPLEGSHKKQIPHTPNVRTGSKAVQKREVLVKSVLFIITILLIHDTINVCRSVVTGAGCKEFKLNCTQ